MSDWTSIPAGRPDDAAEQAAREEKHRVLVELLAPYADGELPAETVSQIDAHLVGCARCRQDLAIHHAVRHRLGVEPPIAAPPALRERIAAAIAATPLPEPPVPAPALAPQRRGIWVVLVAAGLLAVVAAGSELVLRQRASSATVARLAESPASVPLIRDALADYRRVTGGDLPGRARDLDLVRAAVPFPVEPLRTPPFRLLAAWTTELGGEPAAVLAYRWDDRVVLEYLVTEDRFFHHPAVRRAVQGGRLLAATDEGQGIVGWPTRAGGAILIGDLPADRLARALADPLVRTAARGAQ